MTFTHRYALKMLFPSHSGVLLSHWGRTEFPHQSLSQYQAVREANQLKHITKSSKHRMYQNSARQTYPCVCVLCTPGRLLPGHPPALAAPGMGQHELQSPSMLRPEQGQCIRGVYHDRCIIISKQGLQAVKTRQVDRSPMSTYVDESVPHAATGSGHPFFQEPISCPKITFLWSTAASEALIDDQWHNAACGLCRP